MVSDYHSLTVSISQAQTLGLPRALLLHCLSRCVARSKAATPDNFRNNNCGNDDWCSVDLQDILDALPFWKEDELWDIALGLEKRNILQIRRELSQKKWTVRLHDLHFAEHAADQKMQGTMPPEDWHPDPGLVEELQRHQGIDPEFVAMELGSFRRYMRDTGVSISLWNTRLRSWILRAWRQQQIAPLNSDWHPGEYAVRELQEHFGVPMEFIEEAVPEFVCFWIERDAKAGTWDSKFIKNIKIQWQRFQQELRNGGKPALIPQDWKPSVQVQNILQQSNIPTTFSSELIPEFILYWRERGIAHNAWNALFLRHVKREWAGRKGLHSNLAPNSWEEFVATHTDPSWHNVH